MAVLFKVVLGRVNGESGLDGGVEQVGLGKSKEEVGLAVAQAGLNGERFAESEEVVGAVGEADKGAGQTADAALQSDAVLALLFDLEREIDGASFFVELAVGGVGIVGLKLIEVSELVEAE